MSKTVRMRMIPALLALAAVVVLPGLAKAQAPTAWIGTWKLNVAKSVYNPGPPPFTRVVCKIEPWQDGGLKLTYDMVAPRGQFTHLEWIGKFDGQDYVVEGVDYVLTNAYQQADDHTFSAAVKVDGNITAISKITISPDGKTMTTVTEGANSQGQPVVTTTVYEKQ